MVPNCVIFALYVLGTLCNLPWKYLKSVEILFLKNLNEIVVIIQHKSQLQSYKGTVPKEKSTKLW